MLSIYNDVLTSESGPLSAPGQVNETNSWHRLCTTKLHTETEMKLCNYMQNTQRNSISVKGKFVLNTIH